MIQWTSRGTTDRQHQYKLLLICFVSRVQGCSKSFSKMLIIVIISTRLHINIGSVGSSTISL